MSKYMSGYALRAPKVVRIGDEGGVEDIDALERLYKLYEIRYDESMRRKRFDCPLPFPSKSLHIWFLGFLYDE